MKHLSNLMSIPYQTEEVIRSSYDLLIHRKSREILQRHQLSLKQLQLIEKFIGEKPEPVPGTFVLGRARNAGPSGRRGFSFP